MEKPAAQRVSALDTLRGIAVLLVAPDFAVVRLGKTVALRVLAAWLVALPFLKLRGRFFPARSAAA